jgi:hypothetical protein
MCHRTDDSHPNRIQRLVVGLLAVGMALSCKDPMPTLDPSQPWQGDNRERLDAFIAATGSASPDFDPLRRPLAVFDWDNTMARNDVGDATFHWLLRNEKVRAPPAGDWSKTSPFLTPAALAALGAACGDLSARATVPTASNTACADELLAIYSSGSTRGGAAAFSGFDPKVTEPAYLWLAALLSGYPPETVRTFARAVVLEGTGAALGATLTVGTTGGLPAWLRLYEPMADLTAVLRGNGFDVWVVSASPQLVVEAFASQAGFDAAHVIGIRTLTGSDGTLTPTPAPRGPTPGNALIPFKDGKRAWINTEIFGGPDADALTPNADLRKRPAFGAGDSDGDVSFLVDTTGLRLAFQRGKPELTALSTANADGLWLLQAPFIP